MENWKKYLSLAMAFVFATLASVSVYQFLNHRDSVSIAKPDATLPVVVAKRDLAAGVKLTEEDLAIRHWPEEVAKGQYFNHPKSLVGRMLRASVITEEPFMSSKLLEEGESFSSLIPPDMRGVTITVRKSATLAKLLERGSVVDVIALFDNGTATPRTKVIAQAVRVLAVHDRGQEDPTNPDRSKYMEVTLLVKPRDAEWLVIAMNKGTIELVMRNERDPHTAWV